MSRPTAFSFPLAAALALLLASAPAQRARAAVATATEPSTAAAKPAVASPPQRAGGRSAAKPAAKQSARKAGAARAVVRGPSLGALPQAQAFAAEVAQRRGLPLAWVQQQLQAAHRVESVRQLIMPAPAGVAKNWTAYRDRFVEPQRIAAGLAFWAAHERWLTAAEARWGVPAEVVVGIIGVETYYGRITGGFAVLDALGTLAFAFPSGRSDRSAFFRGELEEFLVLCHREGLAPATVKGSYAGAMGLPQFMPGSWNRLALDFDGDGHVDLHGSPADAIGSVAHYLAEHGWRRGVPATFDVTPPADADARAQLLAADILPTHRPAAMSAAGAVLPAAALAHDGPLALVELQNGDAPPSHVAGTQNFWAVTRYNWSAYYAMGVLALGDAVKARRAPG